MTVPEFANRYDLVKGIGGGGMGDVYLAYDKRLERDVALKVLKQEYANDREFVERFKREARSAAGINHPNVVQVYETGEGIFEGRNLPYISMEHVPGDTLKDLIVRCGGLLPPPTAVDVALQVAKALRAAHGRGVIHRDIKPQNILLTNEGEAKVADFGIAKAADWTSLTEVGAVIGTVDYMSPEQRQGQPVGPKSDLYSLGVVLYEMLTGETSGPSRAPKDVNPDVPGRINAVTVRLLAKEPGKRYLDADALIEDLEQALSSPEEDKMTAKLPTVPYVSGRSIDEARWVIESAGLVPAGSRRKRSRERAGTVLASDPPAGTQVYPRTPVKLVISTGSRGVVPWIAAALALIVVLLLGAVVWSSGQDSSAPDTVEVPDLVGMTEDAAEPAAGDDFEIEVSGSESSDEPQDTILSQDPRPGGRAEQGTTISLVMSAGPEAEATSTDQDASGGGSTSGSTGSGSTCPASYEADWSSGMDGWAGSSDWKHVSGMLVNDGSNSDGSTITAPCRPASQDYAIEAEIQVVNPAADECWWEEFDLVARTGIYGGYSCENQELWISTTEDTVASKDFSYDGEWHVWRLEVQGNTIRLFMDGAPLLEGTDNLYLESGEIGIYSYEYQINVRSFRYTEL